MSTVTNKGMETLARMINNVAPVAPFGKIATGTSSIVEDIGNTALGAENTLSGTARVNATCSFESPGTSVWTYLFAFSGAVNIREIGIFNSTGDMFLRHVLNANKPYYEGESVEITITHSLVRG